MPRLLSVTYRSPAVRADSAGSIISTSPLTSTGKAASNSTELLRALPKAFLDFPLAFVALLAFSRATPPGLGGVLFSEGVCSCISLRCVGLRQCRLSDCRLTSTRESRCGSYGRLLARHSNHG